jgi:hypothetical protein
MKIRPVGRHMMKLIVAIRNFTNASKNGFPVFMYRNLVSSKGMGMGINLYILTYPEFTYGNGLHIQVFRSLDTLENGSLLILGLLSPCSKERIMRWHLEKQVCPFISASISQGR